MPSRGPYLASFGTQWDPANRPMTIVSFSFGTIFITLTIISHIYNFAATMQGVGVVEEAERINNGAGLVIGLDSVSAKKRGKCCGGHIIFYFLINNNSSEKYCC